MYVGVILNHTQDINLGTCIPHVCGGDPEFRINARLLH